MSTQRKICDVLILGTALLLQCQAGSLSASAPTNPCHIVYVHTQMTAYRHMQAGVKGAIEARFQVASLHCQLSDSSAASCCHAESGTTLQTSHLCNSRHNRIFDTLLVTKDRAKIGSCHPAGKRSCTGN